MATLRFLLPAWLRKGDVQAPIGAPADGAALSDIDPLAYPPADPGLPYRSVAELLSPHTDLIARIKLAYGADSATFERDLLSLIRRYAAYVHLLPATADNYFSAPGGLLRLGLETAFFSLQATDGQIFSGRSTISVRRQLEPRWRHATFIAGLCHELHRTVSQLVVTDRAGEQWPAFLLPLDPWLAKRRRDRFFVRWIAHRGGERGLGVFALPHIVAPELLQHLAQGNDVVVPQLIASITGAPDARDGNVVAQLVRRCAALVIDRDLRASTERLGRPVLGAHLERYLLDGLRRLAATNPAWQVNAEKSRVWFSGEGLFVIWPNAAADLLKLLETDQLPGIPKSPDTLAEILVAAGIAERRDDTQLTWRIHPPPARAPVEALRIADPAMLFPGVGALPPPLSTSLLSPPPAPAPSNQGAAAQAAVAAPAPPGAAAPASPVDEPQLSIPLQEPQDGRADDPPPPSAPARPPDRPVFRLRTPHRLSPLLAGALQDIVATLNTAGTDAAACRVARGLFVPLAQIERRRVDPGMAVRALAELQMLAPAADGTSKTVVHDLGGVAQPGVVIAPSFVSGLDRADLVPAAAPGD
jgi:conjugal transfer pilus assembly protein TraI